MTGRLFPVRPGVVSIRSDVGRLGRMQAVVLANPDAVVSHVSAAILWELADADPAEPVHITVPSGRHPRARDLVAHRRAPMPPATRRRGIAVTRPFETLVDLAATEPSLVEAAVNEADRRGLVRLDDVRRRLAGTEPRRGTGRLADLLERHTVTDSELERRFLEIVRRAGLPIPETQVRVNGFRVDFYWRHLGLVVETDGLTYHRTPAQQAKDRHRDQIHTAAGLTCLRFTNVQVRHEAGSVASILQTVAARLDPSVRNRPL